MTRYIYTPFDTDDPEDGLKSFVFQGPISLRRVKGRGYRSLRPLPGRSTGFFLEAQAAHTLAACHLLTPVGSSQS